MNKNNNKQHAHTCQSKEGNKVRKPFYHKSYSLVGYFASCDNTSNWIDKKKKLLNQLQNKNTEPLFKCALSYLCNRSVCYFFTIFCNFRHRHLLTCSTDHFSLKQQSTSSFFSCRVACLQSTQTYALEKHSRKFVP